MDKEKIVKLLPALKHFIRTTSYLSTFGIVFTFIGYFAAGWFWWQKQHLIAIVLATAGFILFRLARRYSVLLALKLIRRNTNLNDLPEMIAMIEEQRQIKDDDKLLDQLSKIISLVEKQKH